MSVANFFFFHSMCLLVQEILVTVKCSFVSEPFYSTVFFLKFEFCPKNSLFKCRCELWELERWPRSLFGIYLQNSPFSVFVLQLSFTQLDLTIVHHEWELCDKRRNKIDGHCKFRVNFYVKQSQNRSQFAGVLFINFFFRQKKKNWQMIQLQQNTEKLKYKQIFRSNENNSHTCVEKIQKMKCKMQT